MYKTKQDIIDFVKNYQGKLNTDGDKAKFAAELGEQIKQMDFRAKNGGAAIAYSGWFGNESGVQSQIFRTAQNISEHSNGAYSFINDAGENLLNDSYFVDELREKIGKNAAAELIGGKWTDKGCNKYVFGSDNVLTINDLVSDNYMRVNARGDVLVLMNADSPADSVLGQTELPRLIDRHPDVTAINGVPVEELRKLTPEQRFRKVAEASVRIQETATFYRGSYPGAAGDVEFLDLSGKGADGDRINK
ncbi:hypothetical protein ACVRXQ_02820 [Streptococcus panodentis]|uniref:Uncharacterized protein n=1 Tax=Streptococcus panodentis TaxID=1581472 RepID=A0ABS5AYW8_9STRE|nr:hypothetical protein [Streptococcus panodentis]MBP2621779.1 hypothetical protein [Streptococcus panodentis]